MYLYYKESMTKLNQIPDSIHHHFIINMKIKKRELPFSDLSFFSITFVLVEYQPRYDIILKKLFYRRMNTINILLYFLFILYY